MAIARHPEGFRRLCRLRFSISRIASATFSPINEFVCFTDLSYKTGQFAPGLKLPAAQVNQVRHHGILAHGLGVQAIRANAKAGTLVGLAENANVYILVIENSEHIEATPQGDSRRQRSFLTALMEGNTPDGYPAPKVLTLPKSNPAI